MYSLPKILIYFFLFFSIISFAEAQNHDDQQVMLSSYAFLRFDLFNEGDDDWRGGQLYYYKDEGENIYYWEETCDYYYINLTKFPDTHSSKGYWTVSYPGGGEPQLGRFHTNTSNGCGNASYCFELVRYDYNYDPPKEYWWTYIRIFDNEKEGKAACQEENLCCESFAPK